MNDTKCNTSSVDEFGTTGNCNWFECLGKNILGAMWQLKTILGRIFYFFSFFSACSASKRYQHIRQYYFLQKSGGRLFHIM